MPRKAEKIRPARHESRRQEAARQLQAILRAVDERVLDADSSLARRLLRRIEGAVTALERAPRKKS